MSARPSRQGRRRSQPVRNSPAHDRAFFKRARAAGATTILNPAPAIRFGPDLLDLVDILVLNETELGFLTGTELRDTDDDARFVEAARSLPSNPDQIVCVTLGSAACWP